MAKSMIEHAFRKFVRRTDAMRMRVEIIPFDPRFNAIHWLLDCQRLAVEIEFSVSQMEEAARRHMSAHKPGSRPAHTEPAVDYYADNAITRIFSFRDKLALCLFSYFADFDPYGDERLDSLESVLTALRQSQRALGRGAVQALQILEPLSSSLPKIIKTYRHYKVHRREPRVEIYGVAPHHDWSYLVPIKNADELSKLKQEIDNESPDPESATRALERCKRYGIYYRQLRAEHNRRLMDYREIQAALDKCRPALYEAAAVTCLFLSRRAPFRRRSA